MIKLKQIPVKKNKNRGMEVSMDEYEMSYSPNFRLIDRQMPEIKDWEVGEKYQIVVEVEMTSKNEVKNKSADKIGVAGSFDILAYKTMDGEDMSDEDLENMQGMGMSK